MGNLCVTRPDVLSNGPAHHPMRHGSSFRRSASAGARSSRASARDPAQGPSSPHPYVSTAPSGTPTSAHRPNGTPTSAHRPGAASTPAHTSTPTHLHTTPGSQTDFSTPPPCTAHPTPCPSTGPGVGSRAPAPTYVTPPPNAAEEPSPQPPNRTTAADSYRSWGSASPTYPTTYTSGSEAPVRAFQSSHLPPHSMAPGPHEFPQRPASSRHRSRSAAAAQGPHNPAPHMAYWPPGSAPSQQPGVPVLDGSPRPGSPTPRDSARIPIPRTTSPRRPMARRPVTPQARVPNASPEMQYAPHMRTQSDPKRADVPPDPWDAPRAGYYTAAPSPRYDGYSDTMPWAETWGSENDFPVRHQRTSEGGKQGATAPRGKGQMYRNPLHRELPRDPHANMRPNNYADGYCAHADPGTAPYPNHHHTGEDPMRNTGHILSDDGSFYFTAGDFTSEAEADPFTTSQYLPPRTPYATPSSPPGTHASSHRPDWPQGPPTGYPSSGQHAPQDVRRADGGGAGGAYGLHPTPPNTAAPQHRCSPPQCPDSPSSGDESTDEAMRGLAPRPEAATIFQVLKAHNVTPTVIQVIAEIIMSADVKEDEMETDWYEAFGLTGQEDCPSTVVRKAYRELALRHHPDKQPDDPQAAQRFSEYSKMYEVLGDPDMRAAYDSLRAVVEAQRKRKKEVTHVKQQMSQKVQRKREQAQQLRHKIQTLESQLATPPAQRRPSVHSGTPSPAAWQSPWPAPSTPQAHRTEGEPLVRNLCTEFEDTTDPSSSHLHQINCDLPATPVQQGLYASDHQNTHSTTASVGPSSASYFTPSQAHSCSPKPASGFDGEWQQGYTSSSAHKYTRPLFSPLHEGVPHGHGSRYSPGSYSSPRAQRGLFADNSGDRSGHSGGSGKHSYKPPTPPRRGPSSGHARVY